MNKFYFRCFLLINLFINSLSLFANGFREQLTRDSIDGRLYGIFSSLPVAKVCPNKDNIKKLKYYTKALDENNNCQNSARVRYPSVLRTIESVLILKNDLFEQEASQELSNIINDICKLAELTFSRCNKFDKSDCLSFEIIRCDKMYKILSIILKNNNSQEVQSILSEKIFNLTKKMDGLMIGYKWKLIYRIMKKGFKHQEALEVAKYVYEQEECIDIFSFFLEQEILLPEVAGIVMEALQKGFVLEPEFDMIQKLIDLKYLSLEKVNSYI